MGKGRKRKQGARTAGGRLSRAQPPDRGSERIQAARALFAGFLGGKAEQQVFDVIGRAWAAGLLENDRVDPAILRDAGREYGDGYWCYFPNPKAVASYGGRSTRAVVSSDRDGQGEYFQALDAQLDAAGRAAREAVHALVVDYHHFPDEDPAWLGRLINQQRIRMKQPVCGHLPRVGDGAKMIAALCGLLALVGKRG